MFVTRFFISVLFLCSAAAIAEEDQRNKPEGTVKHDKAVKGRNKPEGIEAEKAVVSGTVGKEWTAARPQTISALQNAIIDNADFKQPLTMMISTYTLGRRYVEDQIGELVHRDEVQSTTGSPSGLASPPTAADIYFAPHAPEAVFWSWTVVFIISICWYRSCGGKACCFGGGDSDKPSVFEAMKPLSVSAGFAEQIDFDHGLFECFSHGCGMCMVGFCCPGVRWSDTVSMGKLNMPGVGSDFFSMLAVYWVLYLLADVIGIVSFVGNIVITCVFTYQRQALRERFGMPKGNFGRDWMIFYWCSACAIIQEAVQVEAHAKEGSIDHLTSVVGEAVTYSKAAACCPSKGS